MCGPDAVDVRNRLRSVVAKGSDLHRDRAVELLSSLDNKRFFQGFAEVVTLAALQDAGWALTRMQHPGPSLEMKSPAGRPWTIGVLAFLHQTRPGGEESSREMLATALKGVSGKHRFIVLIRRWLPHDFDVAPVRRAIEAWLTQVARDRWEGRYAAYDDDRISLEFCLTGEKVRRGEPLLAMVIGPFLANRTLEAIEPRVVRELDRHNAGPLRDTPMLLVCGADQPWALSPGYARDFLYGRPRAILGGAPGETVTLFSPTGSIAVFRDPTYRNVGGVVLLDRNPAGAPVVNIRAWLNPWAERPSTPSEIGFKCFAEDKVASSVLSSAWHEPLRAMTWQGDRASMEIG
ncbi:MAG: hypothetical protein EXR69_03230 [Myxococcales bacterium]|nr:hypothetical protein [Myxococcales bacterium]